MSDYQMFLIEDLREENEIYRKDIIRLNEELFLARRLMQKILRSDGKMSNPLHTLHPSHYTALFAKAFAENNVDAEICNKFLDKGGDL